MKKYEIWIANLDPSFGTEAGKIRPVVIIQTNLLNSKHSSTIICPITTNVKPTFLLTRVHLVKGEAGLSVDSDIMIDQIRTIDNKRLIKKLGVIEINKQKKLNENLRHIMDL